MQYFVDVLLPLALPKPLTYTVSFEEFQYLRIGMRVAVPVKNKIYTALVLSLHEVKPLLYEPREIFQIIDEFPVIHQVQLQLWDWIASYYMCSLGEVFRAAFPSTLLLESETQLSLNENQDVVESELDDNEFLIFEALQHQSSIKIQDVMDILGKKSVLPVINRLLEKKIISLQEEIQEEYKPKLVKYLRFVEEHLEETQWISILDSLKSEKQKRVILSYFQLKAQLKKPITIKQLTDSAQVSVSVVKSLVEKNIFGEYFIQEDRVNFEKNREDYKLELSKPQEKALIEVIAGFETKEVTLLHGVTASGKTEIYIKLIESHLSLGKQVLYLLPEIALTTQLVTRLTRYFGNKVAVYHSKYSNNERVEVWYQVLNSSSKAQIVIGARSSIFLPFSNLGLIIIDEEHESTFKQSESAPRYHARDTAIVLAKILKSKVLLGSATPSIESYQNAITGKYGLVTLKERYGKVVLPEIQLVDLKDAYFRKRMKGHFSNQLLEEIQEVLSRGEQAILFQNRRGFSPVLECMTCGHVPQCPSCDVSLTYHKTKNQLRCHYCGYAIAKPTHCHTCSSSDLTTKGFGTEQIEMELATFFPDKIIRRMDQDTTQGKYSFERIIDGFKRRETDILVGTQMLAKGLDFDNVTLVGILNADNLLYYPDFRAFERSFQMLTQVAGRSGRSDKKGKVIIQTYNPMHSVIQQVTNNDYESMFKEQLYERNLFKYPPFYRVIRLTIKNRDFEKLRESSLWLYQVLSQQLSVPVLGPEEPPISRIRNEYIRLITIKIPVHNSQQTIKKTIQKIVDSFDTIAQYKSVKVLINVDYY